MKTWEEILPHKSEGTDDNEGGEMNITISEARKLLIADILDHCHGGNDKIIDYLNILYPDSYNIDFASGTGYNEIIIEETRELRGGINEKTNR